MKVFENKEEIRQALQKVKSLDYKERPKVMKKLKDELDHGGVSKKEFREVVQELKNDFHISDVDADNLLKLIK